MDREQALAALFNDNDIGRGASIVPDAPDPEDSLGLGAEQARLLLVGYMLPHAAAMLRTAALVLAPSRRHQPRYTAALTSAASNWSSLVTTRRLTPEKRGKNSLDV